MQLTRICLTGEDGINGAMQVSQKLAKAIAEKQVSASDYSSLLDSIAKAQPRVFLDVFVGGDTVGSKKRRRRFGYQLERHGDPLSQISDDEVLSWCEVNPALRYPAIASVISPFTKAHEIDKLEWKNIVFEIFKRAPDLDCILKDIAAAIRPQSWSGSLAEILQKRLVLFQGIENHENSQIRAWAKAEYSALQESIRFDRERETRHSRERNERFE